MRNPIDVLWTRSNLQTGLSVLCTLALLMFVSLTPAHAIFKGKDRSDADSQSAPAVGAWTPGSACSGNGCIDEPGYMKRVATSNAISYRGIDQRCLLTARHARPWDEHSQDVYPRVVMQADVELLFPSSRDQLVAKTRGLLPKEPPADPDKPSPATFRDLRVNWVENRLDNPETGDVRIHVSEYVAQPIELAPLDRMKKKKRRARLHYKISGYGHSYDNELPGKGIIPLGWGHLRLGMSTIYDVSEEPNGGGARMRTRNMVAHSETSECLGDSGAAALVDGHGVFSGVSFGSTNRCDPKNRFDYTDPNPDPNKESNDVNGEFVLHTVLNSTGKGISSPPEVTPWEKVGNWEQVVYFINDICTKNMSFDVSGFGSITGYIDRPLEDYGTERLNKKVACIGSGNRLWGASGDCFEAVHQPEDLLVTAVPLGGWEFLRWSDGPFEIDPETNTVGFCPCIGQGAECKILFDQIGHYTATGSSDLSYCMAEFGEDQVVGDEWDGGGIDGF